MADIYFFFSGTGPATISNTQVDSSYTKWTEGTQMFSDRAVTVELTDDKFILPSSARNLFNGVTEIIANFSKFDTSNCTNMSRMFYNASTSTPMSLDMSSWDLSKVTTMNEMFSNNKANAGISSITFGSHPESTKLTNIGYMFNGWLSGTTLDMSGLNTSNVTEMRNAFRSCSNLTSITFGGLFKTDKAMYMQSMFNGDNKLSNLDLSTFNTSSCTNMSSMFYGCSGLTGTLDLSNFDTNKVTDMSGMFTTCTNLEKLNISNFDISSCTTVQTMFLTCINLTEIDAGICDWSTKGLIDTNMFTNDTKLPNFNASFTNSTRAHSKLGGYFKHYGSWEEFEAWIKEDDTWNKVEVFI